MTFCRMQLLTPSNAFQTPERGMMCVTVIVMQLLLLVSHLTKQLHNLLEPSPLLTSLSGARGKRHIMCDDLPVLH